MFITADHHTSRSSIGSFWSTLKIVASALLMKNGCGLLAVHYFYQNSYHDATIATSTIPRESSSKGIIAARDTMAKIGAVLSAKVRCRWQRRYNRSGCMPRGR
jgi:hypothetical protein